MRENRGNNIMICMKLIKYYHTCVLQQYQRRYVPVFIISLTFSNDRHHELQKCLLFSIVQKREQIHVEVGLCGHMT